MSLANKLTFLRIVLCPFFVLFLFLPSWTAKAIAFFIFIGACLSDLLDGYFARRRGEVTSIGKIIDPAADKVLAYSAFICFVQLQLVPFWMVIILMGRDFWVMALRVEAARKNMIISASKLAKLKTAFEYGVIVFILLALLNFKLWKPEMMIFILMAAATLLSLISGFQYWLSYRRYLP